MKQKYFFKLICVLLVFSFTLTLLPLESEAVSGAKLIDKFKSSSESSGGTNTVAKQPGSQSGNQSLYSEVQKEYEKKGFNDTKGIDIKLGTADNTSALTELDGKKNVVLWEENIEFLEWTVEIPESGLYGISVEYYPLGGSSSPIQRSIMIDGEIPFREAYSVYFNRVWNDKEEPKVNNVGDEVKASQMEIKKWQTLILTDQQGLYSDPFRFYLTKGTHKIRLIYEEEPMALGNITVHSPEVIPSYKEVSEQYTKKGYKEAAQSFKFEAESSVSGKSDPTIRRESDNDPMSSPASTVNKKLNIMGGWRWRKGNQSITWKFTVPEDGLYKIGSRSAQWFGDGLPVYRQIEIDNKVPFSELKEYKYTYNKSWTFETLSDENNKPYLFYLEKGEHELTMTVKTGALADISQSIYEDVLKLSDVIRQITMLTGTNPDANYEYELDRNIPNLLENLTKLSESMEKKADILSEVSAKKPAMANNFMMISDQLKSLVKDPDSIPLKLNDLNNALNNLGIWGLNLQDHPLAMDYFMVGNPDEDWSLKAPTFWQKLYATWQNFISSFTKDYNNIGSVHEGQTETKTVLNVWVSRGKEWAEIIKELADEDFTPRTGIGIKINVLPASQLEAGAVNALLLAICSGDAPDVACSVGANSPVEFAIRDAVADLAQFSDFDDVKKHFLPKIMTPFEYNGGVYALPETMNFKALFYRKDIIEELGIKIPNTWEDVYRHLLPVLYQHGMQFYFAPDYSVFLFQRDGKFYNDEGTKSALDMPEAYQAFREFTEIYTNYNVPVNANFFNRMRQGEMPIGIGDYGLYTQLSVAAPELAGRWDIAPIPGHITENGEINRSAGGLISSANIGTLSTANIILNQSVKKQEAWEFLKWWTSDETQEKFGKELESLMGVQARWNTANVNAFTKLPWNKEHLKVIQKQWEWANEMPIVLGGYFTQRHLNNAWNRVVLGETNVRDSLEMAIKDINRELRNKQTEYGFISD